jgi:hypothetical protein
MKNSSAWMMMSELWVGSCTCSDFVLLLYFHVTMLLFAKVIMWEADEFGRGTAL